MDSRKTKANANDKAKDKATDKANDKAKDNGNAKDTAKYDKANDKDKDNGNAKDKATDKGKGKGKDKDKVNDNKGKAKDKGKGKAKGKGKGKGKYPDKKSRDKSNERSAKRQKKNQTTLFTAAADHDRGGDDEDDGSRNAMHQHGDTIVGSTVLSIRELTHEESASMTFDDHVQTLKRQILHNYHMGMDAVVDRSRTIPTSLDDVLAMQPLSNPITESGLDHPMYVVAYYNSLAKNVRPSASVQQLLNRSISTGCVQLWPEQSDAVGRMLFEALTQLERARRPDVQMGSRCNMVLLPDFHHVEKYKDRSESCLTRYQKSWGCLTLYPPNPPPSSSSSAASSTTSNATTAAATDPSHRPFLQQKSTWIFDPQLFFPIIDSEEGGIRESKEEAYTRCSMALQLVHDAVRTWHASSQDEPNDEPHELERILDAFMRLFKYDPLQYPRTQPQTIHEQREYLTHWLRTRSDLVLEALQSYTRRFHTWFNWAERAHTPAIGILHGDMDSGKTYMLLSLAISIGKYAHANHLNYPQQRLHSSCQSVQNYNEKTSSNPMMTLRGVVPMRPLSSIVSSSTSDLYARLNLHKMATPKAIQHAYHAELQRCGGDNGVASSTQHVRADEIKDAYRVLSNPTLRTVYDQGGLTAVQEHETQTERTPMSGSTGGSLDMSISGTMHSNAVVSATIVLFSKNNMTHMVESLVRLAGAAFVRKHVWIGDSRAASSSRKNAPSADAGKTTGKKAAGKKGAGKKVSSLNVLGNNHFDPWNPNMMVALVPTGSCWDNLCKMYPNLTWCCVLYDDPGNIKKVPSGHFTGIYNVFGTGDPCKTLMTKDVTTKTDTMAFGQHANGGSRVTNSLCLGRVEGSETRYGMVNSTFRVEPRTNNSRLALDELVFSIQCEAPSSALMQVIGNTRQDLAAQVLRCAIRTVDAVTLYLRDVQDNIDKRTKQLAELRTRKNEHETALASHSSNDAMSRGTIELAVQETNTQIVRVQNEIRKQENNKHQMNKAREHAEQDVCVFCLEPCNNTDTGKVLLKCTHVFHEDCLQNMLTHGQHNTCPTCRAPIQVMNLGSTGGANVPMMQDKRKTVMALLNQARMHPNNRVVIMSIDTMSNIGGGKSLIQKDLDNASVEYLRIDRQLDANKKLKAWHQGKPSVAFFNHLTCTGIDSAKYNTNVVIIVVGAISCSMRRQLRARFHRSMFQESSPAWVDPKTFAETQRRLTWCFVHTDHKDEMDALKYTDASMLPPTSLTLDEATAPSASRQIWMRNDVRASMGHRGGSSSGSSSSSSSSSSSGC